MAGRLYTKTRNYLASHKRLALFLSHGGLHVAVLICLIAGVCMMAYSISQSSKSEPMLLDFEFGDRTRQSKLTNFNLSISTNKYDTHGISLKIKTAYSDTWFKPYKAFEPYIKMRTNKRTTTRSFSHRLDSIEIVKLSGNFGIKKYGYYGEDADSIIYNSSDWSRTIFSYRDSLENNIISDGGRFQNDSWNKNPYYSFYIRFHYNTIKWDNGHGTGLLSMPTDSLNLDSDEPFNSQIKIRFEMDKFDADNPQLVSFTTIQPTPSKVGFDYVLYDDPAQLREILSNGIYIEAEDVAMARQAERKAFLFSVLLGTLIAFMLDVIVTLVLKWRRLAKENND